MIVNRTRIVCLPRSGHTWLANVLGAALGSAMVYSEFHSNGKTLENSPEINVQKTHDFGLDTPYEAAFVYIIQTRNFPDRCLSWFKLEPHAPFDFSGDYVRFTEAAHAWSEAWQKKWLRIAQDKSLLVLRYEELVADPIVSVCRVLGAITDLVDPTTFAKAALMRFPPKDIKA